MIARRVTVSLRSLVVGLVGLGAIAVIRTMVELNFGGDTGALIVNDIGGEVVVLVAAITVLSTATHFGRGEGVRRQWMLIGLGVSCFAIGDGIWAWIEVFMRREVPYPGLPDLFYLAQYVFIAIALFMAANSYRSLLDVRPAAGIAATATVVMVGLLYAGFLQPYVLADTSASVAERALSTFYPLADVVFLIFPSLMVLLIVSKLGVGGLAWPWWFVTLGGLLLALSDTGFSLLNATGHYSAGSIIDYGWLASQVAFAVGASLARDVLLPTRRRPSLLRSGREL